MGASTLQSIRLSGICSRERRDTPIKAVVAEWDFRGSNKMPRPTNKRKEAGRGSDNKTLSARLDKA